MVEVDWVEEKLDSIRKGIKSDSEIEIIKRWAKDIVKKPVERVSSGIPGLDPLMEGGFPKGSHIVLSGYPGTGKSSFGMAFVAEGCRNNEKCLYMTVEQPPAAIIRQGLQFNYDFPRWEEQGLLHIAYLDFRKSIETKVFETIKQTLENGHYSRWVIDSVNPILETPLPVSYVDWQTHMPSRESFNELIRINLMILFGIAEKNGVTTVYICQRDEKDLTNKLLGYIADGLITMERKILGNKSSRTTTLEKLRLTKIDDAPHNAEFTENGLSIID